MPSKGFDLSQVFEVLSSKAKNSSFLNWPNEHSKVKLPLFWGAVTQVLCDCPRLPKVNIEKNCFESCNADDF